MSSARRNKCPHYLGQAALLERVVRDAGVTRVMVSDAVRTRLTAGPTAAGIAGLSLSPRGDFGHNDTPELVAKAILDAAVPGSTTLVVSHSHHIPGLLRAMGGWTVQDFREVPPADSYKFLFVVTVHGDGRMSLIRAGYPPSAR